MLQSMRENMKGAIAVIIVGFLGLIMALSLVDLNSLSSGYNPGEVAVVNDRAITERELQLAISQERQRLQSQFGNNLPAAFTSAERLREPALQGLIHRSVLLDKASDGLMAVSDEEVDKLIVQLPQFQTNGEFDQQLFINQVRGIGHTPGSFKQLLREDLLVNQLRSGLVSTSFITDSELKSIVELSRQTRDFDWVTLPLGDLPESMVVSDEEISAYYEENKSSYKTEEKVAVEYIDLKVSDIAKTVIVGEDQIQEQYKQELEQFAAETTREAAHIMIEGDSEEAQQKVIEVQQKLSAGEDFAELAKAYSDDFGTKDNGGNLGISSGDAFPPEFEEALALMQEGDVSKPIKINDATHIVKLLAIEKTTPPSIEESKLRIESELKSIEAEQIFVDKLTKLKDESYNAESLKQVSENLSLSYGETAMFSRKGGSDPVLSDTRVVDAAFSEQVLEKGYASDVMELAPNHAVVVKKIKHEPVRTLTLDEKRDEITTALKLEKAKKQLAEQAESYRTALASGESIQDLATKHDLELKSESNITREGGGLAPALVKRVFELPRPADSPVTSSLYLDSNDYVLLTLKAVNDAKFDELSEEEKRSTRLSLTRTRSVDEFKSFQEQLVTQSEVEIH